MPLQEFSKGNTNMEITQNDINRIHDRLDPLVEDVAFIKAALKLSIHQTPCRTLRGHLGDHTTQKRDWKRAVINGFVDLLKMGVVAALTYFLVIAKGGS